MPTNPTHTALMEEFSEFVYKNMTTGSLLPVEEVREKVSELITKALES